MSQPDSQTTGWQPMETAPKDGTAILLHIDWEPLTVVGYWGKGQRDHDGVPDDGSPRWRVKWDQSDITPGYSEPTHWASIPEDAKTHG